MPLRDHFRSPVDDLHSWDSLHGGWPMKLVDYLQPRLSREFAAVPHVHLGGSIEVDFGTFERDGVSQSIGNQGGTATATLTAIEPTLSTETDIPDLDEYEVHVHDLSRARRLVAAIELLSPANKDRPETRQAFVAKCAALIQQHVSVMIVDVVPVREFNLYAELLAFLGRKDRSISSPPQHIYAAVCRGRIRRKRWHLDAWHLPLTLGQPLPTLPLWLTEDFFVPLELESSYEETCLALRIS